MSVSGDTTTGADQSTTSLLVSYQWRPGEMSYMGCGIQPKWRMAGETWPSYAKGHLSVSFKSDVVVPVRIELRATDKKTYAYSLPSVPTRWAAFSIPFESFVCEGHPLDLTTTDIDQIVVMPGKLDYLPHSLWIDNVAISKLGTRPAVAGAYHVPVHVPLPFRPSGHALRYTGVNIACGAFAHPKPGERSVYGKSFTYPTAAELDYFRARGVNVIRLPFLWEVLQPSLNAPIIPEEMKRLKTVTTLATSKGLTVVLDPHDFQSYFGNKIGGPVVSNAQFATFWTALANQFKGNPKVWFALMNEPNGTPIDQWFHSAQAAVTAIRKTGARNLILVPGEGFTGAHSWLDTGSDRMAKIVDPANNYQFEVHQYLDDDNSGMHPDAVSPTIGSERLATFTAWCRKVHKRAFLGEFGTAPGDINHAAIDNMLGYMEKNRDVWLGYTWWAAGAWWGEYMYNLEPTSTGEDRPQMLYLTPHMHGM